MAELHEILAPKREALAPPPNALVPPRTRGRELSDVLGGGDPVEKLSQSYRYGSEQKPEQAARVIKAQEASGLPQRFVEQNLDHIEKQIESRAFDSAAFRASSPVFADWLAKNPQNVSVAKDDLGAMSALDRALWSVKTFGGSVAASLPSASSALYGGLRAAAEVLAVMDPQNAGRPGSPTGIASQAAAEFARRQRQYGKAAEEWQGDLSQVGATERAVYGGAKSFGQMLLTLPLLLATKKPVAGLAPMGSITFGDSYGEAREKGKGIVESIGLAAPDTVAELVTERWGVGVLLRDIGLKKSFLTIFRNWLVKEGLGEQAATVWQDFNNWAVLNPDKSFKAFYLDQRVPRAWETFVGTIVAGGGMAAVGKSIDLAVNRDRPAQQEAIFRALGDASAQSKLRERVPERFREFVDEATKDGPVTHVYVPVKQWDALFQIDAREAAIEVLGDAKQYDEASTVSGGDLVIPISTYVEKIAGAPVHEQLIPDLRLRQGDLSIREYAEAEQAAPEIYAEQEETARSEFDAQASMLSVQQDVHDMVRPFMGEAEATRVATLEAARYVSRAERLGVDAAERWKQEGPLIKRDIMGRVTAGALSQDTRAPDDQIDPRNVIEIHPPRDKTHLASLVQSMRASGWTDRPLLAWNTGNGVFALTGSHRIAAARMAGIDVPVLFVDEQKLEAYAEAHGLSRDDIVGAGDERVMEILRDAGDERAALLMEAELQLFQPDDGRSRQPRGQFERAPAGERPLITLFGSANPSTVLHELGHSWLEELRRDAQEVDAPGHPQLKADWDTIRLWAGIPDGVQQDAPIPTDAHERFARGAEAYLREGKAPSLELRDVFARFKDWLVHLYRSIRGLNVELTDEVRGVFDRLLATDEQIAQAQQVAGHTSAPIPFDAMTAAEQAEYSRIVEEARMEAEERVRSQLLREFARERQDWWRNEKAQVEAQVAREIDQEPLYRALSWLRTGQLPDGSDIPGIEPQRLSRAALVSHFGAPLTGFDLRQFPPLTYQAEGGLHPDVVADLFGFMSGRELLQAIVSSPSRSAAIKAEVDRIMMDRHGDMLNDGSIAERAAEAVHGDKQAQVLLTELRILNRLGAKGKPVPAQAMKALAKQMVADKTVGELRPRHYELAGARAAREAEQAMIADQFDAAFIAKSRQLMNLYLLREVSARKQDIDKALKGWRVFNRPDARIVKTRDLNLVNAGRAILGNYGIGATEQPALDYLALVREYDATTYADLEETVRVVASERKPYTALTVAEFDRVRDVVDGLWTLSRFSQQMLIDGRRVSREAARDELVTQIVKVGHAPRRLGYTQAVTKQDGFKLRLLAWKAALRRTEHWVDAMDGGSEGPFRKFIWQPISDAADRYRQARKTVLERYLDLTKGIEGRITADKIEAPEIGYTFGANGSGRAELIGAMLHTGNQSNLEKLLAGRGWGEMREDGTLDRSRWDAFIRRMHDEGVLTKQDWDFVQGVWDLMETQKPAAQRAHREMYGHYFDEITAASFDTPFGAYRGGYFPAIVDPLIVPDGQVREDQDALLAQPNSFMFPTTGRGFTKARAAGYRKALQLDLRFIPQHLDKVLRFTHIEPRVKEVGRLVNDSAFRDALRERVDATVASEMLIPWLQRAATQSVETVSTSQSMRALDGVFRELRSRTGAQIMVGNVTNALQQFTGISSAAIHVPIRYLRDGLFAYMSGPSDLAEAIAEKSSFMRNRTTAAAMEVQKEIDNILLNPSKYKKARAFAMRHGYFLQTGTQNIVDLIAWRGAYSHAIAEGADDAIAVRRADSAVRMTQGTFAAEDLSGRFETGSATMRAFTMFYSYFNTQANMLGSAFGNAVRATGFSAPGRLFYIYIFGVMLPAVIAEAITQVMSGEAFADDDDDGYLDNFMSIFFGGQAKFGTAMVPVLGQAAMAGLNMWNDKWYDDRMSTSPVVSVLESVVRTPHSVYMATVEDGSWKRAIKDTLTTVGLATGLPIGFLGRPLGYLADVEQGRTEPANAADYVRGLISGRGPK